MKPAEKSEPKKPEWPKLARGPQGNTARFQCRGDVPAGWVVVGEEIAKPAPPTALEALAEQRRQDGLKPQRAEAPFPSPDELAAARADYTAAFGKRPGPKWDAATIRQKIAEKA